MVGRDPDRHVTVAVERTVMLTDAVVAIAMTLLVLPLVEAVPEIDLDDVWGFVAGHVSLFVSFVASFLVILLFWGAHHRTFGLLTDITPAIRWLSALWLLLVAFLPFPTALIGRGPTQSTTPFYIGTVTALAAVSAAMTYAAARSVEDPEAGRYLSQRSVVAGASALVALGCALVALALPDVALFGLLLIVAVRAIGDRWTGPPPGDRGQLRASP